MSHEERAQKLLKQWGWEGDYEDPIETLLNVANSQVPRFVEMQKELAELLKEYETERGWCATWLVDAVKKLKADRDSMKQGRGILGGVTRVWKRGRR